MNTTRGVTVYDYSLDEDEDGILQLSVTIADTMTPSEVIAALVDAFGEAYVATLGEAIRQRGKKQRMRRSKA